MSLQHNPAAAGVNKRAPNLTSPAASAFTFAHQEDKISARL
jgi:hypothetical protein